MALFGMRWRLREGERAEPSDAAVAITWLGSLAWIVITGGFLVLVWHAYSVQQHSFEEARRWGAPPGQVVQVTPDPGLGPGSPEPLLGYAQTSSQTIEVAFQGDETGCWLVALKTRETGHTVTVTAVTATADSGVNPDDNCQVLAEVSGTKGVEVVTVQLRSSLGDRTVVDGSDGKPLHRRP